MSGPGKFCRLQRGAVVDRLQDAPAAPPGQPGGTGPSPAPDRVPAAGHPGQLTKAASLDKVLTDLTRSAGHRDPGDKAEAHTSEEELGITTPTKEVANDES